MEVFERQNLEQQNVITKNALLYSPLAMVYVWWGDKICMAYSGVIIEQYPIKMIYN